MKMKGPEKMSLALLDHLFDRETQAISNISGTGKHGKRQLNPILIYGIKCKCCIFPPSYLMVCYPSIYPPYIIRDNRGKVD